MQYSISIVAPCFLTICSIRCIDRCQANMGAQQLHSYLGVAQCLA